MTPVLTRIFGDRGSLLRSIVVNVSLALLGCVILATSIIAWEFYEHLQERTALDLRQEAQEIAQQIRTDAPDLGLTSGALRFRGDKGVYRYTVFDRDMTPVVGGELSEMPKDARQRLLSQATSAPLKLGDNRMALTVQGPEDTTVLVSTETPKSGWGQVKSLLYELGEQVAWLAFGAVILMAAAIATARRIQAPLRKTADQLKAVAPGTPDIRLGKADLPTEFAPFVASVNAALDRLEEGYQAQRDFSSNVAHEVRTPLAVLRSTIELVENTTLRNDLLEDLERLDRLFSQLIELARADAAGERAMTTVDLNRIAIDLAAEESLRALRQNRSLAVTGAGTAPAIGHAGLLNVALGNLVRNALAHSPEGTEIEIEVLASPPGWRVYDRGPGVPDDMKPVIFDRFERGKTNAHEGGVGIGLSIVWAVMQAHGGHCRVEDRKGGGAVFTLELPEA